MKLDTLIYTRGAYHITRYHNTPTRRNSSVAEHSYGVANIVLFLTEGEARARLLKAALHHDVAEIATGDLPAPVKKANPAVKAAIDALEEDLNNNLGIMQDDLSNMEKSILKFADCMDGLLYTMEEYDMGNTLILPILKKWVNYLEDHEMSNSIRGSELMNHFYEWEKSRALNLWEKQY